MKTVTLSVLLALGAAFAAPAFAQDTGPAPPTPAADPPIHFTMPDPGWDGDAWRHVGLGIETYLLDGLRAFEKKNFTIAERKFDQYVATDTRNGEANLYLGVTRMQLGRWEDAKAPLEVALENMPRHPDPKSRLGVTYAMLGDINGAHAQRADLVRMAASCKDDCTYIRNGIAMIDAALTQAP
jgi:tetratricopeptide (TPR) repeat protein